MAPCALVRVPFCATFQLHLSGPLWTDGCSLCCGAGVTWLWWHAGVWLSVVLFGVLAVAGVVAVAGGGSVYL